MAEGSESEGFASETTETESEWRGSGGGVEEGTVVWSWNGGGGGER